MSALKGKLDFEYHDYKIYRRETRLDSIFGFKSWDSEYADNFSSIDSNLYDVDTNSQTFEAVKGPASRQVLTEANEKEDNNFVRQKSTLGKHKL